MAGLAGNTRGAAPKGGGKTNKPVQVPTRQPTARPVQVPQPSSRPVVGQHGNPVAAGVDRQIAALPNSTIGTLTPKQIKNQAVKSITAAYAPAINSIQQQETQASGLAAKRSADDQLYANWMQTQTAALQQSAATQDGALTNLENSIQGGINQNAPAQMAAGQQGAPNTVSNMSQSNIVGSNPSSGGQSLVSSLQNAGNTQQLGALQGSTGLQGINEALVNSLSGNNQAIVASNQGNIQSDLQNTMNALDSTLATTHQSEAKDTLSLVNQLNSNNLTASEHNQDYGLQRAGLANTIYQQGVTNQDANRNFALNKYDANRTFNQTTKDANRSYNLQKGQDVFGDKLGSYNATTSRISAKDSSAYHAWEEAIGDKTLNLKGKQQFSDNQHRKAVDTIDTIKANAYANHLQNSDQIAKSKSNMDWKQLNATIAHWTAGDTNTANANAIRDLEVRWNHQIQKGNLKNAANIYNLAVKKYNASITGTDGANPLTKDEVSTKVQAINDTTAMVNDMVVNGGLSVPQARHLFTDGGQYQVRSQSYDSTTGKMKPIIKTVTVAAHAPSDAVAWSGFSMSRAGGGLTGWDLNQLTKSGLTVQDLQNANFHLASDQPAAPAPTFPPPVSPNLIPYNGNG